MTLRSEILNPAIPIEDIAASVTNSAVQAVGQQLLKLGCEGGLSDSRALRFVVYAVVAERIAEMRGLTNRNEIKTDPLRGTWELAGDSATTLERVGPATTQIDNADRTQATYVEPLVVRPQQACELLSIGLTRLYALIRDGELESFLVGRARRITKASINALIRRQLASSQKGWTPASAGVRRRPGRPRSASPKAKVARDNWSEGG